jgi:hypothetical protein
MKVFLILWVTPDRAARQLVRPVLLRHELRLRILSRDLHDLVFTIYGDLLGIPPESIPPLVLKAIILDTFLVLGFIVIKRRRKQIWSARAGWLGLDGKGEAAMHGSTAEVEFSRPHEPHAAPAIRRAGQARPAG